MMKIKLPLAIAALVTTLSTSLIPLGARANTYGEEQVQQDQFIAVAIPFGGNRYTLTTIEQIPGQQECWSESGSAPTTVNLLLNDFDFTGHCKRATDSNGYSVRLDGQDYGLDYLLNLVERDGELQLVANNRSDRSAPPIVIGRTNGIVEGEPLKITLDPGWQFTKRTYEGKELGHVYFSGDTQAIAAAGDAPAPTPTTPETTTASFSDVANDIYSDEIEQAVALGFVAGYQDDTFRPEQELTREQLVSMVYEAMSKLSDIQIEDASEASLQPYPDVPTSRWSAAKVQWAKQNQIVQGYPDGTFRPEQAVTRAEMMAILREAAQYVRVERGNEPSLNTQQATTSFADLTGHWGEDLITQMSAYCNAATPYNETGSDFYPDMAATRNYAAAATLRVYNCLADNQTQAVN